MEDSNLLLVRPEERFRYMDYLLMADESETIVKQYFDQVELFAVQWKGKTAGVTLFVSSEVTGIEIKNLAIDPRKKLCQVRYNDHFHYLKISKWSLSSL